MSVSGSDSEGDFASAESDTEERVGPSQTEKAGSGIVTEGSEAPVPVSAPSGGDADTDQPISNTPSTNTGPQSQSANIQPPSENIEEPNIDPPDIVPSSVNIDSIDAKPYTDPPDIVPLANTDPPDIEPSPANTDPPNIEPSPASTDPPDIEPSPANTDPPDIATDIVSTDEPSVVKVPPTSDESGDAGGGGGWGGAWAGWGGSLWSSVSTVAESAQAIGKKVTSVIASVEDTLGVPSPEELVESMEGRTLDKEETKRLADDMVEHDVSVGSDAEPVQEEPHHNQEEEEEEEEEEEDTGGLDSSLQGDGDGSGIKGGGEESELGAVSGFFSGFAAAVQTTGQGFVSGGLDALETLGKKTMEVLSEGDPGLAKKRAMLGVASSPTLSQLLKEAMEDTGESGAAQTTPINYSRFFDEYHGVGHLEALELLSKECGIKTHGMFEGFHGSDLCTLQEHLAQLLEAFSVEEDQTNLDDDSCQLGEIMDVFADVTLTFKLDKLIKVSAGWREEVDGVVCGGEEEAEEEQKKSSSEVFYEKGLRGLAEMTSSSIEVFRKMAEMSLITDIPSNDPLVLAKKFNRLTVLVTNEFDGLASVYSEAITSLDLEGTNSRVASLYLESSNSGSYVQDAFQLLLPIFKLTLMQQQIHQEPSPNILNRN